MVLPMRTSAPDRSELLDKSTYMMAGKFQAARGDASSTSAHSTGNDIEKATGLRRAQS